MCPDGGLCGAAVEATGQHCPEFYLSDAPVPRASAAAARRARWLGFYADCGPGRASPLTSLAPLYYAMRQKHGGQPVTPAGGGGGDRSPPAGLKLPAWVVATGLLGMLVLAGMVVHQAWCARAKSGTGSAAGRLVLAPSRAPLSPTHLSASLAPQHAEAHGGHTRDQRPGLRPPRCGPAHTRRALPGVGGLASSNFKCAGLCGRT